MEATKFKIKVLLKLPQLIQYYVRLKVLLVCNRIIEYISLPSSRMIFIKMREKLHHLLNRLALIMAVILQDQR